MACNIRHEISMTSLRYPVGTRTVIRNGSHNDSILELDVDVCLGQRERVEVRAKVRANARADPLGPVFGNGRLQNSHNDSILELDVDVFALQTKQGFSVVVPLSASEVLEPAVPEDRVPTGYRNEVIEISCRMWRMIQARAPMYCRTI
jgi:hypothetical protein